jgi:CheY-like chemotaxis protein
LLPLATDVASETPVAIPRAKGQPESRPPDGLTVLLVDDEDDVRDALRLILQQNGLTVTTASSVPEAFELLQREQPDILLSDIAMPGEDGLSFIRRVRLLPPGSGGLTPAAALSAYASAGDRKSALLAGFQFHIAKPVDPGHLLAVIASMAQLREKRVS